MHRHKTVAQILLILSILNSVLAAPVVEREMPEARDAAAVRVPAEGVVAVLEKRIEPPGTSTAQTPEPQTGTSTAHASPNPNPDPDPFNLNWETWSTAGQTPETQPVTSTGPSPETQPGTSTGQSPEPRPGTSTAHPSNSNPGPSTGPDVHRDFDWKTWSVPNPNPAPPDPYKDFDWETWAKGLTPGQNPPEPQPETQPQHDGTAKEPTPGPQQPEPQPEPEPEPQLAVPPKATSGPQLMTPEKIKATKIIAGTGLLTAALLGIAVIQIEYQDKHDKSAS